MQGSLFNTEDKNKQSIKETYKSNPDVATKNGLDKYICVSWLQKSIRRCNEKDALMAANELIESRQIEYLWRRLAIIAVEDIGFADLNAIRVVKDAHNLSALAPNEKIIILFAVLYLARAPKNREMDEMTLALNASFKDNPPKLTDIPDYAFDKHSIVGKERLRERGIRKDNEVQEHWITEASLLKNVKGGSKYALEYVHVYGKEHGFTSEQITRCEQFMKDLYSKKIKKAYG